MLFTLSMKGGHFADKGRVRNEDVVVKDHDEVAGEMLPQVAVSQIVATRKALVLRDQEHGDFLVTGKMLRQTLPGAVRGGVVHNDDMLFSGKSQETFRALQRHFVRQVMENDKSGHNNKQR